MDMLHWLFLLLGLVGMAGVYFSFKLKERRGLRGAQPRGDVFGRLQAWSRSLLPDLTPRRRGREQREHQAPELFSSPGGSSSVDRFDLDTATPSSAAHEFADNTSDPLMSSRGTFQDGVLSEVRVSRTETLEQQWSSADGELPPGVRRRNADASGESPRSVDASTGWAFSDGASSASAAGFEPPPDVDPEPAPGLDHDAAPAPAADAEPEPELEPEAAAVAEPAKSAERIVVLHVMAGEEYVFTATAVVREAQALGMQLDANDLLQAFPAGQANRTPWFGLASVVSPGVFPPRRLGSIETPGVALFMRIPGPFDSVVVFERMLDTARRLATRLEGHVLDQEHQPLTAQGLAALRASLRDERRRNAEVAMRALDDA